MVITYVIANVCRLTADDMYTHSFSLLIRERSFGRVPVCFLSYKYLLKVETGLKKNKKRLFSSALWLNFVSGHKNNLKSFYTL